MARYPTVYTAPFNQQLTSLSPILPMSALSVLYSRLTAAIPQGAWLEGSPSLLLDSNFALRFQFSDGSSITLPPSLFDIPCPTTDIIPYQQLPRPASPTAVVIDSSEHSRSQSQDTRGVQTSEADVPVGPGHRSLIFPAIEEMVQAIQAAERKALRHKG
jgi:hypothetical protein